VKTVIEGEKIVLSKVNKQLSESNRPSKRANLLLRVKTIPQRPFKVPIPSLFSDGKYKWTLEDERSALKHGLLQRRKAFVEKQKKEARAALNAGTFPSLKKYYDIADKIAKHEEPVAPVKPTRNWKRGKKRRGNSAKVNVTGFNHALLCGRLVMICIDKKKDWRRAVIARYNHADGRHYIEVEERDAENRLRARFERELKDAAEAKKAEAIRKRESKNTQNLPENDSAKASEADSDKTDSGEDTDKTESDSDIPETVDEMEDSDKEDQENLNRAMKADPDVRLVGEMGDRKGKWLKLSNYHIQEFLGMCWAKVSGLALWPSRIAREFEPKIAPSLDKFMVLFCGRGEHAKLPLSKLMAWESKQLPATTKRKDLLRAYFMGCNFKNLCESLYNKHAQEREDQLRALRQANAPPEDWVGKRIQVFFGGDGKWFDGSVLRYNKQTQKHFILYDDSEIEWTRLTELKKDELKVIGEDEAAVESHKKRATESKSLHEICWFCNTPIKRPIGSGEGECNEDLQCTRCKRKCHEHCIKAYAKDLAETTNRESLNIALSSSAVKLDSGAFGDPRRPWCNNCASYCEHCGSSRKRMSTLLCCEICQRRFHAECLDPRLEHIPSDGWICNDCTRCQCCSTTKSSEDSRYLLLPHKRAAVKRPEKKVSTKSKGSKKSSKKGSKSKRIQAMREETEAEEEDEEQKDEPTLEWMYGSVCPPCVDLFEVRRYCPGCVQPLQEDLNADDTISCDTCKRHVHRDCSGLHPNALKFLLDARAAKAKADAAKAKAEAAAAAAAAAAEMGLETGGESKALATVPRTKKKKKAGRGASAALLAAAEKLRYDCPECVSRRETNCMIRIVERLCREDQYRVFLHPVSDAVAPNYSRIIKTPMDFTTILNRLQGLFYNDAENLRQHINLVWRNALDYNPPDNMVSRLALRLQRLSIGLFNRLERSLQAVSDSQRWKKGEEDEFLALSAAPGGKSDAPKPSGNVDSADTDSDDELDEFRPEDDFRRRPSAYTQCPFEIEVMSSRNVNNSSKLSSIDKSTSAIDVCVSCGSLGDWENMAFCLDCGEAIHIYCLSGPARQRWERADVEELETETEVSSEGDTDMKVEAQGEAVDSCSRARLRNGKKERQQDQPVENSVVEAPEPASIRSLGLRLAWQCENCVTCIHCGGDGDRKQLIVCVDCGAVCHSYCADPPLSAPVAPFRCSRCVRCRHCGSRSAAGLDSFAKQQKAKSAAAWMYGFTMCHPCGTLYQQRKFCPICDCLWEDARTGGEGDESEDGGYVQCDRCKMWVHTRCDDILNDDTLDLLDEDVNYFCPDCRTVSITAERDAAARAAAAADMDEEDREELEARASTNALRFKPSHGQGLSSTLVKNYLYYRQMLLQVMRLRFHIHDTKSTPSQRFFKRLGHEVHRIQCMRKRCKRRLLLQSNRSRILQQAGFEIPMSLKELPLSREEKQRKLDESKSPMPNIFPQKDAQNMNGGANGWRPERSFGQNDPKMGASKSAMTIQLEKALESLELRYKEANQKIRDNMVQRFRSGMFGGDTKVLVADARRDIDNLKKTYDTQKQLLEKQLQTHIKADAEAARRLAQKQAEELERSRKAKEEADARARSEQEKHALVKSNVDSNKKSEETDVRADDDTKEPKPMEFDKASSDHGSKSEETNKIGTKTDNQESQNVKLETEDPAKTEETAEQKREREEAEKKNKLRLRREAVKNPALEPDLNPEENLDQCLNECEVLSKCLICGKKGDHQIGFEGRLLPVVSTRNVLLGSVHSNCAFWSSEVYDRNKDGVLRNVDKAILAGRSLQCAKCKKFGATLRCCEVTCNRSYHFACLLPSGEDDGGGIFQENGKTYCAEHETSSNPRLRLRDGPAMNVERRLVVMKFPPESIGIAKDEQGGDSKNILRSHAKALRRKRYSHKYPLQDLDLAAIATEEEEANKLDKRTVAIKQASMEGTTDFPRHWTRVGALCVRRLGTIEHQHPDFHSERFIFPVGFQSRRIWWDHRRPGRRAVYTCEVDVASENGEVLPQFRIVGPEKSKANSADEDKQLIIEAKSASEAWRRLAKTVRGHSVRNARRSGDGKDTFGHEMAPFGLSGAHFFGFGHPEIVRKIEHLADVHRCLKYTFLFRTDDEIASLRAEEDEKFNPRWLMDRYNPFGITLSLCHKQDHSARSDACSRTIPRDSSLPKTNFRQLFATDFGRRRKRPPPYELRYTENLAQPMEARYRRLKRRRPKCVVMPSQIHNWGLFATEHIGREEMVIEYLGELIRTPVADLREKRYEAEGIGSCYMFRVDESYIVDSTNRGNVSRFINHSCDPNCKTAIVCHKGANKIVIIAKRDINQGEEITYDYKFQSEAGEGIRCCCGAPNCAGRLN